MEGMGPAVTAGVMGQTKSLDCDPNKLISVKIKIEQILAKTITIYVL